jgi:hypothetical protein
VTAPESVQALLKRAEEIRSQIPNRAPNEEGYAVLGPTRTPAEARGSLEVMQFWAEVLAHGGDAPFALWAWSLFPAADGPAALVSLKADLAASDVVLWRADTYELSQRGVEAWRERPLARGDFPSGPQLWFFDFVFPCDTPVLEVPDRSQLGCILLFSQLLGEHYSIRAALFFLPGLFKEAEADEQPLLVRYLPPIEEGEALGPYAPLVAMYQFCQLPITLLEVSRVSRQQQRERARRGKHSGDVSVVVLRPALSPEPSGTHRDVQWSHRWMVRGHWRNQYFPASKAHHVRWVRPHVKGPQDRPLLDTRPRVYDVSRGA